jgi:hypothetical protein
MLVITTSSTFDALTSWRHADPGGTVQARVSEFLLIIKDSPQGRLSYANQQFRAYIQLPPLLGFYTQL